MPALQEKIAGKALINRFLRLAGQNLADLHNVDYCNDLILIHYHALQAVEGLIITGATGTNVNDVAVVLIGGEERADA